MNSIVRHSGICLYSVVRGKVRENTCVCVGRVVSGAYVVWVWWGWGGGGGVEATSMGQ